MATKKTSKKTGAAEQARKAARAKLSELKRELDSRAKTILPTIRAKFERDGRIDRPARAEAWNNWTDGLCKAGVITQRQYDTWSNPF